MVHADIARRVIHGAKGSQKGLSFRSMRVVVLVIADISPIAIKGAHFPAGVDSDGDMFC